MDDLSNQFKTSDFSTSNNTASRQIVSADNSSVAEIELLSSKLEKSNAPQTLKDKANKMIDRLRRMAKLGSYSGEYELIEKYVDWVTSLPFGKYTQDDLDLKNVETVLNKNHFGLQIVKDRILEYIATMKLNVDKINKTISNQTTNNEVDKMSKLEGSSYHAPVICFVGVQGIGKTSMAKSIAESLGRKLVRIPLGALGDVSQLKGKSRAFIGAEPGQVVKALVRAGVSNPLILFDELDKVSGEESKRFDYMAVLLEILDPEQNGTFMDAYLDYPLDLSKIIFICTANTLVTLSAALLDRLEIIRFSSYLDEEKAAIARDYLLPKVRQATGLDESQLKFSPSVWPLLIRPLGFDAGIRQLERNLTTVARKVARDIVEGKYNSVEVSPLNFRQYIPEDIGVYS